MHPWLLYTEQVQLPTYFTCLMIGFSLGTAVLRREARREGRSTRQVFDLALLAVPMVMLGSRVFHILFIEPDFYRANPVEVFNLRHGGFVFYGGVVFGWLTIAAFAAYRRLSAWALGDIFAPAVAFGLIFGRIGCLGAGCCHGRPASYPFGVDVPWSVLYLRRGHLPDALLGVPLHPAPLYEITLALLLFVGLSAARARQVAARQAGARSWPAGTTTLLFVLGYGLGRSLIEQFRADDQRGLWFGELLSTSQALGLSSAAIAALVLAARWR